MREDRSLDAALLLAEPTTMESSLGTASGEILAGMRT
jgi:hypothetical protein